MINFDTSKIKNIVFIFCSQLMLQSLDTLTKNELPMVLLPNIKKNINNYIWEEGATIFIVRNTSIKDSFRLLIFLI